MILYIKNLDRILSKGYINRVMYERAIEVMKLLKQENLENKFDCFDYVPNEEVSFSCFSKDLSITIYVMEDRITIAYAGKKSGILQKVKVEDVAKTVNKIIGNS